MSKELESILIAKQINPTGIRLVVLEFLLKQKTAINLSDLETEFEHSDRTTLYRTLKTFEEKALIHDINDGSGSIKYAICQADCKDGIHHDMHLHFYCTICNELFCLPKAQIPEIVLPDKFKLQEFSLVARGICNSCS